MKMKWPDVMARSFMAIVSGGWPASRRRPPVSRSTRPMRRHSRKTYAMSATQTNAYAVKTSGAAGSGSRGDVGDRHEFLLRRVCAAAHRDRAPRSRRSPDQTSSDPAHVSPPSDAYASSSAARLASSRTLHNQQRDEKEQEREHRPDERPSHLRRQRVHDVGGRMDASARSSPTRRRTARAPCRTRPRPPRASPIPAPPNRRSSR